ncbi:MAG TPA: HEAT repeat domain-containing protein [Ktedonobacteraceae bacterium]|jgi:HEAT repeat protein|nr:HEAT repeat domain-containing protein [Ktedonobacteraceae bacterium]
MRIGQSVGIQPLRWGLWAIQRHGSRTNAAEALGTLGDLRAVAPLIAALGDADAQVREVVATALGSLGDGRAIQPLHALLADPVSAVTRQATQALAQLKGSV